MTSQYFNEDLLLTAAMRDRFDMEGEFEQDGAAFIAQNSGLIVPNPGGGWWAAVQRTNGDVHRYANTKLVIDPTDDQQAWQMTLLRLLNREIHHMGAWVVGWTHDNTRAIWMWLDNDGDVQFTTDNDERWAVQSSTDNLTWVSQCEDSWQHWYHFMREVLDPHEDSLFKRAQGQRAPSAVH